MLRFLIACIALGFCAGAVEAQDRPSERAVYVVKQGAASDLAAALNIHFKGEAGIGEIAAVPASNALLLSAHPTLLKQVLAVIEQLDRAPRTVAVDVWIAERVMDVAVPEVAGPPLDLRDLVGPADQVRAKVLALQQKGILVGLKQFQLTALENESSSAMIGEAKPTVTGVSRAGFGGAGGPTTTSMVFKNVGTMIKVTPRLSAGDRIILDLTVDESRLHSPGPNGADKAGQPLPAETITCQVNCKLSVPSGHAMVAESLQTVGRQRMETFLVVVAPRVLDAEIPKTKEPR